MKKRILLEIIPYFFEGHFILSLDQDWTNICGGVPRFTAVVDDKNRLVLIGPTIRRDTK